MIKVKNWEWEDYINIAVNIAGIVTDEASIMTEEMMIKDGNS
jgi:hypothetical protein